jgi:hypothetical protein
MARYRLTRPAYVAANGNPLPCYFKAGEEITFPDDKEPGATWVPLDRQASAAVAAKSAARGIAKAAIGPTGLVRAETIRR